MQSDEHRQMLAHLLPKSDIGKNTKVSVGFGERTAPDDYPDKDNLVQLSREFDPSQIWRSIVLRHVIKGMAEDLALPASSWTDTVKWVIANPESVEQLLVRADQELDQANVYHLILFDALDRAADDWPTMLKIIRGLLQVLLEFRSYRRIRPKAFVRPDLIEDTKAIYFPDSLKVLNQKVELRWPRTDLYGLLWQYLGNEPNKGNLFREGCKEILNLSWNQYNNVWTVPDVMRTEEDAQETIFHSITGHWMSRDHRRGFPYTWLPSHLGDTSKQVSPRSFLSAIRHTAEDNQRPGDDYKYALSYESIRKGVQKASKIRVQEMEEDYPWVGRLMEPLKGLMVPCSFEEIASQWKGKKFLDQLKEVKLPPEHLEEGPDGIRRDIESLGIFERMTDGRVNLTDVYRVGYGLGRKGGVKAVARE
ncbi:MAG: hypothetical protein HQK89_04400 [Nitrospirae bacterium]|nr:hypothetical protein [Nitrospirota bacterium]